jgi:ketosteroid isomerase-like protein
MTISETLGTEAVLDADAAFFRALLAGDTDALRSLLADDFVIIDVMSGGVTPAADLIGALGAGFVRFTSVREVDEERSVRRSGDAAVVIGRTEMTVEIEGAPVTARSRYAHVFVRDDDRWRLWSAQGTPIAG